MSKGVRLTDIRPGDKEFAQRFIEGEHLSVSIVGNRVIGEACLYFTGKPRTAARGEPPGDRDRGRWLIPLSRRRDAGPPRTGRGNRETAATEAVKVLGCQGYCGVDVVVADKVYVVDVNPRITTSLVGIAACMKEEIADLLIAASKGEAPAEVHLAGSARFDTAGRVTQTMIGIDVGGANLKVVDNDENVHIHYCPLWEGAPDRSPSRSHMPGPVMSLPR